ncbi:hypothetical protein HZH68_003259 [Vespula germanica]|uniref:Uncharacterized protein n=1 Tax=Vespula germanica TaxID=30212 RepID=A0A834NP23_VESGE|nr:hypothetical protein HZH68_003259 [Vespula germanica]
MLGERRIGPAPARDGRAEKSWHHAKMRIHVALSLRGPLFVWLIYETTTHDLHSGHVNVEGPLYDNLEARRCEEFEGRRTDP